MKISENDGRRFVTMGTEQRWEEQRRMSFKTFDEDENQSSMNLLRFSNDRSRIGHFIDSSHSIRLWSLNYYIESTLNILMRWRVEHSRNYSILINCSHLWHHQTKNGLGDDALVDASKRARAFLCHWNANHKEIKTLALMVASFFVCQTSLSLSH